MGALKWEVFLPGPAHRSGSGSGSGSSLCRLKRPVPRRKYGLLSNYDDSVEMVEGESDEDDTLYEARSLRRSEVTHRPRGSAAPGSGVSSG